MTATSPAGRSSPWQHVWIHTASVLTVATVIASWFLRQPGYAPLRAVGPLLGLSAILLMFLPIMTLRKHGDAEPGGSYMESTRVVERGPFAIVRHPQYLGYILLCGTFALTSQHWLIIALAMLATFCFSMHAVREERLLVAKFGKEYLAYMARVPRFNIVRGVLRVLRQ